MNHMVPKEVDPRLKTLDVNGVEEWREYDWNGRTYRINKPVKVIFRDGGTTHRVVDEAGIVHIVPAPGQGDCVIRFKGRVVA